MKRTFHPRIGSGFDNRIERTAEGFNSLCLYLIPAVFFSLILLADKPYNSQPVRHTQWQEGSAVEAVIPKLIAAESGGDHSAVSSKGARGITQIMPHTGRNPGYGVQPVRNLTEKEAVRFTSDYLEAMYNKYDDMDLALAAYNAGPATVDKALKVSNGNKRIAIGYLPKETREYVRKVNGYSPETLGELMDNLQVARAGK